MIRLELDEHELATLTEALEHAEWDYDNNLDEGVYDDDDTIEHVQTLTMGIYTLLRKIDKAAKAMKIVKITTANTGGNCMVTFATIKDGDNTYSACVSNDGVFMVYAGDRDLINQEDFEDGLVGEFHINHKYFKDVFEIMWKHHKEERK